jgi:hypothetical protein
VFADDITFCNLRCGWPINGRKVLAEAAPEHLWLLSEFVGEAAGYWAMKAATLTTQP